MCVLKIIQADTELFGSDPKKQYSEVEAIRLIASMRCKGNEIQNEVIVLRQTHTAICNLISLGYNEAAVKLAIKLIPKAELAQQFNIAQDLCYKLIAHYYHIEDVKSANIYLSLYGKYTLNMSYEHETMVLCNKTILNYKKLDAKDLVNVGEINVLLEAIEKKLPFDVTMYHYYYYQYKSLTLEGKDLEQLYLDAIAYFKNLHHKHYSFSDEFLGRLIVFYLDINDLEKAERYLNELDSGSTLWFRNYLTYTNTLLNQNDLKSNDVCNVIMNHPFFANLPTELKDKWKVTYKATVNLLLDT